MNMKSVIAGEYTAPPAHGPRTSEICGMTPRRLHVAPEDLRVAAQRHDALLNARAAGVVDARSIGQPVLTARSITLQIFSANTSPSEPPKTVKSCEKTKTLRPSTVACPVTTPSP